MENRREFDLIIFGAAGCTGRFTVEELVKYQKNNPTCKFTWAVAGLWEKELQSALDDVSDLTGVNCSKIPKLEADSRNLNSLRLMTKRCKVIISCVGPFRFLGENLVRACLEEGTHLIDGAGEVQYLLRIQDLYHEHAQEKNVYIIGATGFASIPADVGTLWLEQNFPGDLNSVEIFYTNSTFARATRKANYASHQSMIHILANLREWDELEKKLLGRLPYRHKYPLKDHGIIHYNTEIQSWCALNPICDASVVRRTQDYLMNTESKRPVQVKQYLKLPSLVFSIVYVAMVGIFTGLSQFRITRYLMEKFPKIFTLGVCDPNKRISREILQSLGFKFIIVGRGWDKNLEEGKEHHAKPPNTTRKLEVSGSNPFYAASGVMMTQSALTILFEKDSMPLMGGVYTPGVAFRRSHLVDRLTRNGVSFRLIDDNH